MLASNTVPHRFASPLRNALCNSTVTISTLSSKIAIRYTPHALSLVSRRISNSCSPPVLYSANRLSQTLYTILGSAGYAYSVVLFSYGKVLAALTSWALRVVTLLGALALGCNTVFIFETVSLKELPRSCRH